MTQTIESQAWVDPGPNRPVPLWNAVRQDVLAHIAPADRRRSRWSWALTAVDIALRSSGFHLTLLYRLSHALSHRAGAVGQVLANLLFWCGRHGYGCAISPNARLHGGLILPHPQGIVVGQGTVVGPRAWIFQNVTLGGAPGKVGAPHIGADARIYTGAILSGPITVGDNVMVGANAVVCCDLPDRTLVRCPMAEFSPLPDQFIDGDPQPS